MTSNKNGLALIHSGINVKLHVQVAPRIHVLDMADAAMASTEKEPASVTHNTMVFIVRKNVITATITVHATKQTTESARVTFSMDSARTAPSLG